MTVFTSAHQHLLRQKGRMKVTVATRLKQTIATLQGMEGTIRTYVETSQNPQAKSVWQNQLQRMEAIRAILKQRLLELEAEEPRYKGHWLQRKGR